MPNVLGSAMETIRGSRHAQIAGLIAFHGLGAGLGFVVQTLFARVSTPQDYGIYGELMSAGFILVPLATLSVPLLLPRLASSAWLERNAALGLAVEHWLVCRAMGWMTFVALAAYPLFWLLSSGRSWAAIGGCILLWVGALMEVAGGVWQARHRPAWAIWPRNLAMPVVAMIAAAAFAMAGGGTLSAGHLVAAQLIAAMVCVCVMVAPLVRRGTKSTMVWAPTASFKKLAVGMTLVSLLGPMLNYLEVIVLGVLGSPREAGLFFAASRLAFLVHLPISAVIVLSNAKYAAHHAEGNLEAMRRMARANAQMMGAGCVGLALTLIFFHEQVLAVFGQSYSDAGGALCILILGQLLNGIMGSAGYALEMTGHEKHVVRAYVVVLGLKSVLMPWAAIYGGAVEMAWVSAGALGLWSVWMWLACRRHLALDTSVFSIWKRK